MTWVRVREAWLAVSSVVAVGLQDSTSAGEGGERKRERVEQSSRKRWREEISSVQFSGTHYTLQHTLTQPRKKRRRASRALSLVRSLRANRIIDNYTGNGIGNVKPAVPCMLCNP